MGTKIFPFLLSFFIAFSSIAQTFSGVILDEKTKNPIETASVYFDNTTIGTVSNSKGEFSISYTNAIQSSLIISYLGYNTEIISNYRQSNNVIIYLKLSNNVLNEVIISTDDGLTREQKLKLFRKEFLGSSKFAKSCKILNEDDLILWYNKKESQLTARAKSPILIENKALQYLVSYKINTLYRN